MGRFDFFGRGVHAVKVGLAARDVRNANGEHEKEVARRALANLFADGRGVIMKFGQLMAGTGEDDVFKDLVTSIEPLPLDDVLPVMEAELGEPVNFVFKRIEESTNAASLGQVHRATLHDGSAVAVKVQYPTIAEAVDAEMRLFGLMPGVGPVKKWGFDLDGYKSALKENMDRELDYRNEAARQLRFYQQVQVPGLIIPKVHQKQCSARLLVQDWEVGQPLEVARDWSTSERRAVGRVLLSALLKSLFEAGEIHGDPHPGNFAFRRTGPNGPEVILMDFGCTVPIAYNDRMALLKTILAAREGGDIVPLDAFAAMGFEGEKLAPISGSLATLAHIMFEPFRTEGLFFISQWDFKNRFEYLLGEKRWWFRSSGPPAHILLLRGFHGLAQQLDTLRAGLDWYEILCEAVSPETLAKARAHPIPAVPEAVRARAERVAQNMDLAQTLHVVVSEGSRDVVSVAMPAEEVLKLEQLIPEDVLEFLHESDELDVDAIMEGVRARGIEPQEVFNFTKDARRYRIWLD